jgi:hypothetical protein
VVTDCHFQVTHWYNAKIADNPEQQQAVKCVLTGTSGRLPFIIWGEQQHCTVSYWYQHTGGIIISTAMPDPSSSWSHVASQLAG